MSKELPSYLDLPDDELGNPPSEEMLNEVKDEPAQEVNQEVKEEVSEEVTNSEETVDNVDKDTSDEESEDKQDIVEENNNTSQKKEESKSESVDNTSKEVTIDYKAEYERLTAPFKANGREVAVQSVDDAIALMQMGANYSKKMAGLKPHIKVVKMLEKHGLLDESKLGYLIDLHSKNPAAISKLVKDSGLDPLEMDTNSSSDYTPKNYSVDDREIELDAVLEDIKESPNYQRTLSTISSEWDSASKQTIASNPSLLKVINAHMDNGVFDLIHQEMENEKMFGRLNGLSDLEAYRKVGDAIHAKGGFDFLAKKQQTQPTKQVVVTKPVAPVDEKAKDKKRAAAPVKTAPSSNTPKEFNPLALSDEEFAKIAKTKFM